MDANHGQRSDEDLLQDSWVHVSSRSRSNSSSSDSSITSCTERTETSICSVLSSNGQTSEVESNVDAVKPRSGTKVLQPLILRGKTNWNDYDWSSRCEALPPNTYPFAFETNDQQLSPPDSPIASTNSPVSRRKFVHPWSLRHSKLISRNWFSIEVLEIVIITNVISFCLGVLYIGKCRQCSCQVV